MKKQLLLATSIFATGILCAQVANKAATTKNRIPSHLANIAVKKSAVMDDKMYTGVPFQAKAQAQVSKSASTSAVASTSAIIGMTLYDLQSNSSVGDRIVVNADGSIATAWTFEPTDASGSYANRGTGYAYFNGSTWSAPPTARIENARVGWGNIVDTRTQGEVVIAHNGGASKLQVTRRAAKGTGAWANSTTSFPNVAGGNWWPRMVSSSPAGGDTIYSLSISYPGTAVNGLDACLFFSRSFDGGLSWSTPVQPTGFTSANYLGFGGDAYAITAKGSTVAIVAGDSDSDIGLAKSTDGGLTWTYTTVYQFPLPLWDFTTTTSDVNADAVADTINTNDGNFGIALDNTGKVYVAFGAYRLLNDAPSASGYSYFPYTDGLYLWNEGMATYTQGNNATWNLVAAIEDLYGDNNIFFPTPSVAGDLAFGRWGCSLTSYPSMAFDASNNLYLTYSSIVDSLSSVTNAEKLVRHQYVVKSEGSTCLPLGVFSAPMDIVEASASAPYEGIFGSMAKNIDGNVHIIYQRDFYPGNGIPATSGTNPDADNLGNPNDIVYTKIPVGDFGPCTVGIKNQVKSNSVSVLNFYPNPASNNATIDVTLTETAKLDIAILNSVGQTVYTTAVSGNVGSNKVDVNLNNLSAGLYFYQVKIGNSKAITKKFAVEK